MRCYIITIQIATPFRVMFLEINSHLILIIGQLFEIFVLQNRYLEDKDN